MSADEMGMRLGISSIQGHRILKGKLTKLGIIEVVENGVRRSRGRRGIATTYIWNVSFWELILYNKTLFYLLYLRKGLLRAQANQAIGKAGYLTPTCPVFWESPPSASKTSNVARSSDCNMKLPSPCRSTQAWLCSTSKSSNIPCLKLLGLL